MAEPNSYDLVIIDLMLLHLAGVWLVWQMRSSGSTIPIPVLNARDEKEFLIRSVRQT